MIIRRGSHASHAASSPPQRTRRAVGRRPGRRRARPPRRPARSASPRRTTDLRRDRTVAGLWCSRPESGSPSTEPAARLSRQSKCRSVRPAPGPCGAGRHRSALARRGWSGQPAPVTSRPPSPRASTFHTSYVYMGRQVPYVVWKIRWGHARRRTSLCPSSRWCGIAPSGKEDHEGVHPAHRCRCLLRGGRGCRHSRRRGCRFGRDSGLLRDPAPRRRCQGRLLQLGPRCRLPDRAGLLLGRGPWLAPRRPRRRLGPARPRWSPRPLGRRGGHG